MSEVFLKILNMSITAGFVVLAVLILRILLKKAPKWFTVLLWGIVAIRLICPFSVESVMSLIPSAEVISPQALTETPEINTGFSSVNNAVNSAIQQSSFAAAPEKSVNTFQLLIMIFSLVWIVGIAAMLIYTIISYVRVKKKIGTAVLLRDNIYQSENVVSPFVLGIIRPKIFLPFNINEQDAENVIAHEKAHIRRKDHWWKPFGFLILAVHWFNPLIWLAYVLLCRDIELACDEKVIKELNAQQKADYSQALLICSVNRRIITACPLAFGETGVKERVKNVFNYKKTTFWVIVAAIIAIAAAAVCFMTNPTKENLNLEFIDSKNHTGEKILSHFDVKDGIDDILNDYRSIDFYFEPDFDNEKYTVKEEVDAESSTKQIKYYDGDKLVYIDYEGYGEDMFDFFTETKSGKPVKVSYVDENGKRFSVSVSDGSCSAYFGELDKKYRAGAHDISLCIIKNNEKDAVESLNLCVEGEKYRIDSAQYYDGDDFVRYSAYFESEEDKQLTDYMNVLFSKQKGTVNLDTIKSINENKDKLNVNFLFGRHKYSYADIGTDKKWYITSDLRIPFESNDKAEAFRTSLKAKTKDEIEKINGKWYVTVKDVIFPVADNADFYGKSVIEQLTEEINDPVYRGAVFNGRNEFTGFSDAVETIEIY